MNKFVRFPIDSLIRHENVDKKKVATLVLELSKTRVLRKPIVVEKNTRIILDGHHRVEAFHILGFTEIPSFVVSYKDIHVEIRRTSIEQKLLKEGIIRYSKEGRLFPVKTTKHQLNRSKLLNHATCIDAIYSKQ
jgi:L-serine kinase (ADP)